MLHGDNPGHFFFDVVALFRHVLRGTDLDEIFSLRGDSPFFFFVLGVLWGVSDPWLVAQPTTATIAAPHVAAAVKPRATSAALSRSGSCMYVPGIVHIFLPVSANQGRNTGYAWETEVGDSPEGRQHPGVTQNGRQKISKTRVESCTSRQPHL